jgi:DNA repair protein RadA
MDFYPTNDYQQRRKVRRLSIGSNNIDRLLYGGIETHAITEFYGPSSVGKTQICYTLAVIAAGTKKNGKILYFDTEHKFRPERILSISQARGFCDGIISKILYTDIVNSNHQELVLQKLIRLLDRREKISLIIVDSLVNQYRMDFGTSDTLSERQKKLSKFMHTLSYIAQSYGIAIVITNQVNWGNSYTAKPTGGNIICHHSNYRIALRKPHFDRSTYIVAKVAKSSYHIEGEARFKLGRKGVEDI